MASRASGTAAARPAGTAASRQAGTGNGTVSRSGSTGSYSRPCLFIHRQQKRQFILRPDRPDIQKFSFRLRFRLLFVQLRIVLPLFRKFILVQELIIKQQLVILPQFRQFFIQQKLIRFIIQRKQEQRRILQRRRKQEQRLLGQALSNPETANACRTHINTSEK